jgi:hypothetical protein
MKKHLNGKKSLAVRAAAIAAALLMAVTGCGSSDSASTEAKMAYAPEPAYGADGLYEAAAYEEMADVAEADYDAPRVSGSTVNAEAQQSSRKLITTLSISAETGNMDELLARVEHKVSSLGGYIENSDISNGSYQTNQDRTRQYRRAHLTIRVPADKLDDFLSDVQEHSNITQKSQNVEDVTLSYTDLESHKRMLKAEEQRLLEFMEKAETVEDMIAVEQRLTEVQYQLDSMESQLRTYDNLIDYSSVYLDITEVQEFTVTEEPASVWDEIREGFGRNLLSVGRGIRDFFVWVVIHLPQLVIWGVVIFVICLIVRRIRRRKALKKAKKEQEAQGIVDAGAAHTMQDTAD